MKPITYKLSSDLRSMTLEMGEVNARQLMCLLNDGLNHDQKNIKVLFACEPSSDPAEPLSEDTIMSLLYRIEGRLDKIERNGSLTMDQWKELIKQAMEK